MLKPKYENRYRSEQKKDARVNLWKGGKEHTFLVSRLVAMTWCDGYEDGLTVNHIDGNPMNNRVDNLEWMTHRDNVRQAFEDGLIGIEKPVS